MERPKREALRIHISAQDDKRIGKHFNVRIEDQTEEVLYEQIEIDREKARSIASDWRAALRETGCACAIIEEGGLT